MAQLEDATWFTAMMQGPGRAVGSVHIKFPEAWCKAKAHNYGHVAWMPDAHVWKHTIIPPDESAPGKLSVVRAKIIRPESQGIVPTDTVCAQQRVVTVPTSPRELGGFIGCLPEIEKATPLLYSPQIRVSPEPTVIISCAIDLARS